MTKARFYHAGCPVCVSAEQALLQHLSSDVEIDVIHLGEQRPGCGSRTGWREVRSGAGDRRQCAAYQFWRPIEALK